jgi:hypothetical protein
MSRFSFAVLIVLGLLRGARLVGDGTTGTLRKLFGRGRSLRLTPLRNGTVP